MPKVSKELEYELMVDYNYDLNPRQMVCIDAIHRTLDISSPQGSRLLSRNQSQKSL